jgi:PAS domain S-box-containing protein
VLAFMLAAIAALIGGEMWILRPVAGLQEVVGRMERGDWSARARTTHGSPELRQLAASFNEMARTLKQRRADLEASEQRLRAVVDNAPDGIITINESGVIESVNPEVTRLFGYRQGELIGQDVRELILAPGSDRHDEHITHYLEADEPSIVGLRREVQGRRKDGSEFPLSLSIGQFELDGAQLFTLILRDISERKRAEEHNRLLIAEVDHRAKNLLAAIQAMVLLTKRDAVSVADFTKTFVGRLHAMGRAHDLLARDKWTGASLRDLIKNEFQAYAGAEAGRLRLAGEDARLSPRAAQTLSLALHELATNAAKHGALSVPEGSVEIRSAVKGQELQVIWTEAGGPEVEPPTTQGFGRTIVEHSIAHELGGSARLDFARSGLRCHLRIPLR